MESRRLAILCSHLRQTDSNHPSLPKRSSSEYFSWFSTSNCVSNGPDAESNRGAEKEREEKDCVFCKIIRGESPAFKLYEDDVCLSILDLNPLNHGHSLIIPKSHYSSLEATPPSVVASICSKVPIVSSAIMKATNSVPSACFKKSNPILTAYVESVNTADSFNLLVNSGEAAGQVIFHTHLHIIPRKARDHLWTSNSIKRQPLKLDQETTQLADHIREQLSFQTDNCENGTS